MEDNQINLNKCSGLTFIELLVVIAIAGIMIVALTMIVGRVYSVYHQQIEQGLITEDARIQIERVSKNIRNMRSYCQGASIRQFGDYSLQMISNLDNGTDQVVRYYLDGTDLKRDITQFNGDSYSCLVATGTKQTVTLIHTVRNQTMSTPIPIFSYYNANGAIETDPAKVVLIKIALDIDVNLQQWPPAMEVSTEVSLRNTQ
jgi:prepilin-type N-terminal cleavage/methylation domain-containing protein